MLHTHLRPAFQRTFRYIRDDIDNHPHRARSIQGRSSSLQYLDFFDIGSRQPVEIDRSARCRRQTFSVYQDQNITVFQPLYLNIISTRIGIKTQTGNIILQHIDHTLEIVPLQYFRWHNPCHYRRFSHCFFRSRTRYRHLIQVQQAFLQPNDQIPGDIRFQYQCLRLVSHRTHC